MTPRIHTRDAGSALLAAIAFMFIVAAFVSAFLALVGENVSAAGRATDRRVTLALAEGGVAKAAAVLRADPAYRGEPYFALGAGEVMIEAVPADTADRYTVASTARRYADDPAVARITATLVRTPGGVRIERWEERAR